DCLCGGSLNPVYYASLGTCIDPHASAVIAEPSTNWTVPDVPPPACDLTGYADMHAHMFAEYAHGGKVLVGHAYAPNGGGISVALNPLEDFVYHGGVHGV